MKSVKRGRKYCRGTALREASRVLLNLSNGSDGMTLSILSNQFIHEDDKYFIRDEMQRLATSLANRADAQYRRINL